ncbi:hypothetical protein [Candidatus Spongiihabitans sp.]|uniref:hypothetical protein n=1 Tax=Candidatus Spongiihabitans sp. TaxID=3101308 RepID=UPI003C6EA6AD
MRRIKIASGDFSGQYVDSSDSRSVVAVHTRGHMANLTSPKNNAVTVSMILRFHLIISVLNRLQSVLIAIILDTHRRHPYR